MKPRAKGPLTATLEFNCYGLLRAIYLNSENEGDQAILVKGLRGLLKPDKGLLKKIFRGHGLK